MSDIEVKKVYWKRGFQSNISPEVAFRELEKIKTKNGGVLTAGIVVHEASKKSNPLHRHKAFMWDDDASAAHEYRLQQARKMIGSIEVVYKKAPHVPKQRHYVTVSEPPVHDQPERKVYRSTKEVLEDPVARDELLGNAIKEAIAFRKKYALLSELASIFKAIDDFVDDAGKVIA